MKANNRPIGYFDGKKQEKVTKNDKSNMPYKSRKIIFFGIGLNKMTNLL